MRMTCTCDTNFEAQYAEFIFLLLLFFKINFTCELLEIFCARLYYICCTPMRGRKDVRNRVQQRSNRYRFWTRLSIGTTRPRSKNTWRDVIFPRLRKEVKELCCRLSEKNGTAKLLSFCRKVTTHLLDDRNVCRSAAELLFCDWKICRVRQRSVHHAVVVIIRLTTRNTNSVSCAVIGLQGVTASCDIFLYYVCDTARPIFILHPVSYFIIYANSEQIGNKYLYIVRTRFI